MNPRKNGKIALLLAAVGVLSAATVSLADQTQLVSTTRVVTACGELFAIDSNADGMTAAERTAIVQKRLDEALIKSLHRVPEAVSVAVVNRNPSVLLDGKLIVTADHNSAARAGMTQMQLAQKWADSIRACMAHTAELDKYLAMLTGKFEVKQASAKTLGNDEVAVAPSEMLMPIELATPLSTEASLLGDRVEAVITHDVPLKPTFDTYIPAGSLVYGEVVDADQFVPNHYAGKDGFTVEFYEIRLPDGKKIPITAHILGGLNQWKLIHTKPTTAEHVKATSVAVQDNRIVTVDLNAKKGVITGGWKGTPVDEATQSSFRRACFKRFPGVVIPSGEPMLMQLSGTTTIAVSTQTM